jgi:hypothetical protein
MAGQALWSVTALAAAAFALTATAAAEPKVTVASKVQIAIHEQGKDSLKPGGATGGTFTIEVASPGSTPTSGKTRITQVPGPTKYVDGQQRIPFSAEDTLTSSKGQLVIAISGTHIPLNNKASAAGYAVGPAAETGTWKIKSGSGVYQGWKGGGPFASAVYGYTVVPSYSVEFDGYITH